MWGSGALLCSAAELSLGCERSCTNIGCSEHVEVQFAPSITEAGQYRFELDVDGEAAACELGFDPARRENPAGRRRDQWPGLRSVPHRDRRDRPAPLKGASFSSERPEKREQRLLRWLGQSHEGRSCSGALPVVQAYGFG